jgi:uncharacterized protein
LTKLILIVVVTLALVLWFKSMARKRVERDKPESESATAEDMVRCATCGVNLPRSEALMSRGRFYCSEAHRAKDATPR